MLNNSRKPCQGHPARGSQTMWAWLSSLFHGNGVLQELDTSHQPCASAMLRLDGLRIILQEQHPFSFQTPIRRRPGRHHVLQCSASCTVTPECPKSQLWPGCPIPCASHKKSRNPEWFVLKVILKITHFLPLPWAGTPAPSPVQRVQEHFQG